ncbi:hypothetical protein D3C76_106750 [compost metagenome]
MYNFPDNLDNLELKIMKGDTTLQQKEKASRTKSAAIFLLIFVTAFTMVMPASFASAEQVKAKVDYTPPGGENWNKLEIAVQGRLSLHRYFGILVCGCLLEQIVGDRKPPDLKADFWQAPKQKTPESPIVLYLSKHAYDSCLDLHQDKHP